MALFELTELASYMQSDLDTASATLARTIATALVEEVTGPLESRESTVVLPVYIDGVIELPATVVTAVDSVVFDSVTRTDVQWQQPLPKILLLEWSAPGRDVWPIATVTYTHGYPVVPELAKTAALAIAGVAYNNPTGMASFRIDDYSEDLTPQEVSILKMAVMALRSLAGASVAAVTGP